MLFRSERTDANYSRIAIDALGRELIITGATEKIAPSLWALVGKKPRWWGPAAWPGQGNDSRLNFRFALRERAECLAACLLNLRSASTTERRSGSLTG